MPERILVACITGGRPAIADRPTTRFIRELFDSGYDTAWILREDHLAEYEPDETPLETYTVDWADRYSRTHWRHPITEWSPGGFHGAFTGREWAMRLGAERGYDAVIQLDDNITYIGPVNSARPMFRDVTTTTEIFGLLREFAFASNTALLGMQLNSVQPPKNTIAVRPGYPYSAFIEKVTRSRLPYYGPFEDDIMHALDYGLGKGPTTAAIVDAFKYTKTFGGTSGMRSQYAPTRGLGLAHAYPRNVRLATGPRTSSPNETSRGIRHYLNTNGFTPVRITNPDRYQTATETLTRIIRDCDTAYRRESRTKMIRRASKGV